MPLAVLGPILIGAAGTSAAATAAAWGAIGAGVKAGADIYSANKTSGAAEHGADLQADAASRQLDYTKQQAAIDQANMIATQNANYQQYVDRQQLLSTLGEHFGLPARTIAPAPVYQSVNGDGTLGAIAGAPTPTGTAAPAAAGTSKAAALTPQIVQSASQGLNPQDPASLPTLVKRLTAMGYDASVMTNNGAPSDHKVWVNGTPWTFVSSQGYQPGTYKWDPYTQGAAAPSWNAQGMPLTSAPATAAAAPPTTPTASPYATGTLGSLFSTTTPPPGTLVAPTTPWGF